ncbi:MAG TPA: hypothetical protein VKY40_01595 [Halanaerobiales bacterium]|nr:hypothetical protein [Halanaerobiales bacterium]
MAAVFYLKLINIFMAFLLYKHDYQKRISSNQPTKISPKQKYSSSQKENICCQQELANLLIKLDKKGCKIKILLNTASTSCEIKGLIRGLRKKQKVLFLLNPDTNTQWYIPIDKITAVIASQSD